VEVEAEAIGVEAIIIIAVVNSGYWQIVLVNGSGKWFWQIVLANSSGK
jgi:hypothetical protein